MAGPAEGTVRPSVGVASGDFLKFLAVIEAQLPRQANMTILVEHGTVPPNQAKVRNWLSPRPWIRFSYPPSGVSWRQTVESILNRSRAAESVEPLLRAVWGLSLEIAGGADSAAFQATISSR